MLALSSFAHQHTAILTTKAQHHYKTHVSAHLHQTSALLISHFKYFLIASSWTLLDQNLSQPLPITLWMLDPDRIHQIQVILLRHRHLFHGLLSLLQHSSRVPQISILSWKLSPFAEISWSVWSKGVWQRVSLRQIQSPAHMVRMEYLNLHIILCMERRPLSDQLRFMAKI